MRRKDLVPRGTPLWCVQATNGQYSAGLGYYFQVDGDYVVLTGSLPFSVAMVPLHRCFFREEGARAYIRDVLGGGQA